MHKNYHLGEQAIPAGHQIFDERLEVRGISLRRSDAIAFSKSAGQWLEFEPEPTNRNDPNAIKIIGCWRGFFRTKRRVLGYVPREVAQRIAEAGLASDIMPRLLKTYVGHDGFVEIDFQITGPKERYRDYSPLTDSPVDRATKLKQEGSPDEAVEVLMAAVEDGESDAKRTGLGVGPLPYRELAVLYRKLKRYDDEIAILERYAAQHKAPGRSQTELTDRLANARTRRR